LSAASVAACGTGSIAKTGGNGGNGARFRANIESRLLLRLTEGNCSGASGSPRYSDAIEPVVSVGSKFASA
jgi:hypothetical protein